MTHLKMSRSVRNNQHQGNFRRENIPSGLSELAPSCVYLSRTERADSYFQNSSRSHLTHRDSTALSFYPTPAPFMSNVMSYFTVTYESVWHRQSQGQAPSPAKAACFPLP